MARESQPADLPHPGVSQGEGLALVCSPQQPNVEVILVHGLGGSRSSTWINAHGEFWPSWIGEALPNTRVWTYGYNSNLWRTPSEDALELHNARLLNECVRSDIGRNDASVVFICHSLGGILFKSSFVRALHAGDNSQWSHLHNRIKSAIFLGTPHRGSEWANRLYFLFLGASVLRPGSSFVPLLRKGNSALLAAITERFNNAWGTRAVLSFCEEKSTGPLGLIVKPQDARTNCGQERCFTSPYSHRRLAKIMSRSEDTFVEIVGHLKALSQHSSFSGASYDVLESPSRTAQVSSPCLTGSSNSAPGARPDEPLEFPWSPLHRKAFRKYLQMDIDGLQLPWEILDEEWYDEVLPTDSVDQYARKLRRGVYMFCYPGHESTTVILTVPSTTSEMSADWTIRSPNALYHPGRHDGSLMISSDFPFKPPKFRWGSPILSPYVNSYGFVCLDTDAWSPRLASFYSYLHTLASIVIFGPDLSNTTSPAAPRSRPERLGCVWFLERIDLSSDEEDWKIRVCNLFSRAYNRTDDDEELDLFGNGGDVSPSSARISDADRQVSVLAIEDTVQHLGRPHFSGFEGFLARLRRTNARADFAAVDTLKKRLEAERLWVDALNEAMKGAATHAWGLAESFEEHRHRCERDRSA